MKRLWCLALCLAVLSGCAGQRSESRTIFAMDTVMDLTAYGPKAEEAVAAAVAEVNRLDALLSTGRESSDISRINADGGRASVAVSAETAELLGRALDLCEKTDGALDITVYPAMGAWGFPDKNYRVPGEQELTALKGLVNYKNVAVTDGGVAGSVGLKLDLGAVGKGYTGDRIITLWKDLGVTSGLLNLGGNVQCLGAKPDGSDWTIGVRDPADENGYLAMITGRDMAVVTSGAYQRYFEKDGVTYHHILDPETCAPARSGAASVTVVGESGFACDGLSTALYVMGLERAAEYWREYRDFDMIYYTDGGQLWYTSGLEGRLTLRDGLEGQMLT